MRTLRKLVFGETWAVPIGVALTLVVGLLLRGRRAGGSDFVVRSPAAMSARCSASLRRVP